MKSAKKSFWSLALALIAGLVFAASAHALRVNFLAKGDSDVLTFSFDSKELPKSSVRRVGTQELLVSLPDGIWANEPKPGTKDYPGKLVRSIVATANGVQIKTRTSSFGFIRMPSPGKSQFVLQIYRDPIGARWKPRTAAKPAAKPAPRPAPVPTPQPSPQASPKPAVQAKTPSPEPAPQAVTPTPAQQPASTAQPVQQAVAAQPVQGEADLPPETLAGERKPFFSVPYSVRNEVVPPGEEGAVSRTSNVSPVQGDEYPSSSALRFKAENKTAEEVKFAELAGGASAQSPIQQVAQVATPLAATVETSGDGQVGGAVASPPAQIQPQPVEVTQVDDISPLGATAPVSGEGQVGGSVAPPPSVVEGAPPPVLTDEESAQASETVEPLPADQAEDEESPSAESAAIGDLPPEGEDLAATQEGAGAGAPSVDNATSVAEAREEEIRNLLNEAQSMMYNGKLAAALPFFEDILKQPDVLSEVREEALYAVADIKKQINSDHLDEFFEEITQAYIEAMNSNLQSNRVPNALLNLGLINLKVGNFPEAKAYFKILQDKYPDDNNIPSISYYWGEYYYKKGDYKKAADQFQYLIQTYPGNQLVKQSAYYLADSLNKTGFTDQAFQIVDYIDKRWPDYYMENNLFLLLAGDIEMKLKMWTEAKGHYFVYYNLNPEAESADIALARIGDIYVRMGQQGAAKQIYEKVVEDFPGREGALIAQMRLAEEGIYDDPSMVEMVDVFDRPYTMKPVKIYSDIVENYPESPLAPIAQLKLAMWYAFNKKYPEALAAAQNLLEKFPDSPLVARAKILGDSVFALAVPGMVREERYGRVVRYWETYNFLDKKDSKVNDQTLLQIATSYWKIGQPEKALEIIGPFLQEKQVKNVSDEALGLAVNIYLDQLAWQEIADLVAMVKENWTLKSAQLRQLDYARAMSLQNLGDANDALPMWAELAKDVNVDPAFRAYAMYYMAKAAMDRQNLRKVFVYAQEALTLLLETNGDPEKIKDAVLMSIYATERSGRYNEALKWAKEYDRYIGVDNPEWASTRFKLARIYRKAGAIKEWKQLLGDIIEKKPESLQAQLAKSALDTYDLEQQVQQYAPVPQ